MFWFPSEDCRRLAHLREGIFPAVMVPVHIHANTIGDQNECGDQFVVHCFFSQCSGLLPSQPSLRNSQLARSFSSPAHGILTLAVDAYRAVRATLAVALSFAINGVEIVLTHAF